MKKICAIFLILCAAASVTACNDANETSRRDLSESLDLSAVSQTESAARQEFSEETSSESTDGSSTVPEAEFHPEDVYEYVDDTHYWEYGNTMYNPNMIDVTFEKRYYGDFEWTYTPKTLWNGSANTQPREVYDPEAAVAYGRAHWDDGEGLCAAFVSRCLCAGGITEYTESSTAITLQLLNSRLGFGQFVPYDKSDHTIDLPDYARPGDVIQIYCSYEGAMKHSLLMVDTSQRGRAKVVCHNYRNSGEYEYVIDSLNDPCYDCETETFEVFFYHFYREDDEGLPEDVVNDPNIVLWEAQGYHIRDEGYDRAAALKYAADYPMDGLGYFGASHTSAIMRAGNVTVTSPFQTALFLQLMKSRLGSAYSLPISLGRRVYLPEFAEAGDICFVFCSKEGIVFNSFAVAGTDEYGRMTAYSYDLVNDGSAAFKVESACPGCGADIKEVVLFHFD